MKKRITALFVAAMLLTGLFAFAGTAMAMTIDSPAGYNLTDPWIDDVIVFRAGGAAPYSWSSAGGLTITSNANAATYTVRVTASTSAGAQVNLTDGNGLDGITFANAPKYANLKIKCLNANGQNIGYQIASIKVGPNTPLNKSDFRLPNGAACIDISPSTLTSLIPRTLATGTDVEVTMKFNTGGSSWNNWNNWYNAPLFPGDPNYNAFPGSGYWFNGVWIPGTNNPYSYQTTAPVQQAAPNAKSNVGVGGTLQLTSTMLGGVNPYTPGIAFRSSDTRVATITNNGLVTGVGAGVTRITASDGYGRQYGSWDLVVGNKTSSASSNAQAFTLSKTKYTMKRDSEFQLFATSKGQKIQVNWISSNPAIASVDENGWVTTYDRRGKVKITAFISGGSSKVCTLTVK